MMSGDAVSLTRDLPTEPPQTAFRITALTLTSVVGIYCVWLLLAEVLRPGVIGLPVDPQTAAVAAQKRERANRAAQVALIRGDLWAEAGYTSADLLWKSSSGGKDAGQSLDLPRTQLDRAIRYAPTKAGVWLLLAGFASKFPEAIEALRMSYFTGPSELPLMSIRTFIAAQMPALDEDMQQLVRRDVRILLKRQQKSAIIQAWHVASPSGKRLIEQEVRERDPSFAQELRRGAE
jgi:hypothetical protein